MPKFRVAVIGAGQPRKSEKATGFGMADKHTAGYIASGECELVAVADISRPNAEAYVARHPGHNIRIYEDHRQMLREQKPDFLSVCVWIDLHRPMVLDAIEAGVKAIHCEKPMASTFGEAKAMVAAADRAGTQLTFNHQRRLGHPFREAKRLLDQGEIGDLVRLEAACSNLLDWGTHWLDMMFFYNNETPVEWVIGQIDAREERQIFGVRLESQGLSQFRFRNGVHGLLATGPSMEMIRCANRLVGTKGVIEVGVKNGAPGPNPRIRRDGQAGWETIPTSEGQSSEAMFVRAIREVIDAFKAGRRSTLDCHHALQADELIFATYESSRRRARIDLPLDIEDSPFLTMLARGEIGKPVG